MATEDQVGPPGPVMPFGKHKGKALSQIKESYLVWLQKNCNLDEELAFEIEAELQFRRNNKQP